MKTSTQHKEILNYITSFVTGMNPPSLNETKEAYLGAFENVMTIWFKEYNTASKISKNKVILYESFSDYEKSSKDKIFKAYLVGYKVEVMNGDYAHQIKVVKNRYGNYGINLTQSQWEILIDCVLNDKPQPDFMKTISQEDKERDAIINFYKARLAKTEVDLFTAGYVYCPELPSFSSVTIEERFSRIEKILGVNQGPNDISLARLENMEYHFNGIKTRLGTLENDIFKTFQDVMELKPITTIEGRFKRLEDKLGVDLSFTDLDHRLKHIEDAWNCTKLAREWHYGSKDKMPYTKKGIAPIYTMGKFIVYQDNSDMPVLMPFKGSVTIGKPVINCPYIPKYKIGDVLEFHKASCVYKVVTHKIIRIGLLIKTDPNTLYYNFDSEDGYYIQCEQLDKDINSFKVNPPVAWEG